MTSYSYIAVSKDGKQFKGNMNANGVTDLQYKLSDIGLELITANETSGGFLILKELFQLRILFYYVLILSSLIKPVFLLLNL